MARANSARRWGTPPAALTGILLAVLGLLCFTGSYKIPTLLAGLAGILLLRRGEVLNLRSLPALLLLGYVVFAGLTRFWAMSGKFFLREYAHVFVAAVLFLAVMLKGRFDRSDARWTMKVMAVVSTVYSLLSVEAATLGLSRKVLAVLMPAYESLRVGFESDTRLTGILGNANILASIVAFGVFFSLCLWCGEENGKKRLVWAGVAAVNAFTFLLLFSMGGTASFLIAAVLYLIFAGKGRGGALVRMLVCALPTVVWVFVAFPLFNGETAALPLAALAGCVLSVILLEKVLAGPLSRVLEGRDKLIFGVMIGAVVLVAVYAVIGLNLTGAYTFDGNMLERSAYPEPGEYTLNVQSDGAVKVTVISQDMSQVMMHTNTVLYRGEADGAVFTVPENSEVCYFRFSADEGVVLEEAALSSGETIKLGYAVLPGFVANRLQGLWANQNAVQRTVFFKDGLKLFAQSPLVGSGMGSFETGVTSVQDFYYETKYVHNHYIQVLLECGVIGFVPFLGALGMTAWLLIRKRREEEWEFSAEYPALWAALGMALCHMAVEVSMSNIIFVCMVFTVIALIIRCCGETGEEQNLTAVEKGKLRKKRKLVSTVSVILPAVFVVTLCGNLLGTSFARKNEEGYEKFLSNLETAILLDVYEGNDAKLSYVMNVYNMQDVERFSKATKYADSLMKQQSNSIPAVLLDYYLGSAQYVKAVKAANASAMYSASDEETWEKVISTLRAYLLDAPFPALMVGDSEALVSGVKEYYDLLVERNARSMDTVKLDLDGKDFFGKIFMIDGQDVSVDAIMAAKTSFVFDSRWACDADGNGIPDQVADYKNASFAGGAVGFKADGQVKLDVRELAEGTVVEIRVQCENPDAITVKAGSKKLKAGKDGVWTYTMTKGEGETLKLTFTSSVEQGAEFIAINAAD